MIEKINFIFEKKQKMALAGIALLSMGGAFLELLGVSAIFPLLQSIIQPEALQTNRYYLIMFQYLDLKSISDFIVIMSLLLMAVYAFKNTYLIIQMKLTLDFNYENRRIIANKLMNYYLHQSYLYHTCHNVADLQRNVTSDVTSFFTVVSASMSFLIEITTCLFLSIYMFYVDWMTALMIIGLLGILFLGTYKIYKKTQLKAGKESREASAALNKWLLQSFGGIKEVKVLNQEEFFLQNYNHAFRVFIHAGKKYNMYSYCPKYIIETICMLSILIVIVIRVSTGVDLARFATTLSAFAVAAMRMLPSFNRITEHANAILFGKPALESIYRDLKEAENMGAVQSKEINTKKIEMHSVLNVQGVSFIYPNTNEVVFEDINLSIQKNESVALIGESGAGKTTLADIILGLMKPQRGRILVDGIDVFENLDAWHRGIGYIPQVIYLMDDTIRANVLFGREDDRGNDEKTWKALKMAQIDEFVKKLPEGLDTRIGDRGVRLSGGQRQRIGIARALYTEPDVLILDEATSSLDTETETAVMESIEHLHGHTTMIIIAHRLSTIQNCDKIYKVQDKGIQLCKKNSFNGQP